jgi:hypothetical protein
VPNALGVLVYFEDPMEGYPVRLSGGVKKPKRVRIVSRERDGLKWQQYDSAFYSIIITQLEVALRKSRVPANAVQQFMNRDHAGITIRPLQSNNQKLCVPMN